VQAHQLARRLVELRAQRSRGGGCSRPGGVGCSAVASAAAGSAAALAAGAAVAGSVAGANTAYRTCTRGELRRAAARDCEADALAVGDAPDARRCQAWVEAQLGLQPWRAAGRQLAHERVETRVALAKRAADEHLEVGRGAAGLERSGRSALAGRASAHAELDVVTDVVRAYSPGTEVLRTLLDAVRARPS
jgi:hypothetical protein